MSGKPSNLLPFAIGTIVMLGVAATAVRALPPMAYDNNDDISREMREAQKQGDAARLRAEMLETQADKASDAADKTAQATASLAARIQQAEAEISINQSKLAIVERQRGQLRAQLATKQQPLMGLTASLQRLSRRPPILSLLRPGSLQDVMHLRAVLSTALPAVEQRTAALRGELARARALQQQAALAVSELQKSEGALKQQRQTLVALETRQRLASLTAGNNADRESERALALAERTRDLDALSDGLSKAGALREELAALPGPVLRPDQPEVAQVAAMPSATPSAVGLPTYILPAAGRLLAGYGETMQGVPRSRGIALAVNQGAQAVAPAPGRIVFAGPYRGYGSIVIVEHAGGWTSLVTGLAQLDTRVGERVVAGSPIGIAGAGKPVLTLELRKNGTPVNPLEYIRSL
jgi:murein hydrolase activator